MENEKKRYFMTYYQWDPYYDAGEYIGDFVPHDVEFDTLSEMLNRFHELALRDDVPMIDVIDCQSKAPENLLGFYKL